MNCKILFKMKYSAKQNDAFSGRFNSGSGHICLKHQQPGRRFNLNLGILQSSLCKIQVTQECFHILIFFFVPMYIIILNKQTSLLVHKHGRILLMVDWREGNYLET